MTVRTADVARALGWEWGTLRTNLRTIRARNEGWLQPTNGVQQGIAAEYDDVELVVADAVSRAWPVDGYGVTYRTAGGAVNDLRRAAAAAVRADHERSWLVVVHEQTPVAFTTDEPTDTLGHGDAVVTVVRLARLDDLLARARAAA